MYFIYLIDKQIDIPYDTLYNENLQLKQQVQELKQSEIRLQDELADALQEKDITQQKVKDKARIIYNSNKKTKRLHSTVADLRQHVTNPRNPNANSNSTRKRDIAQQKRRDSRFSDERRRARDISIYKNDRIFCDELNMLQADYIESKILNAINEYQRYKTIIIFFSQSCCFCFCIFFVFFFYCCYQSASTFTFSTA